MAVSISPNPSSSEASALTEFSLIGDSLWSDCLLPGTQADLEEEQDLGVLRLGVLPAQRYQGTCSARFTKRRMGMALVHGTDVEVAHKQARLAASQDKQRKA